MLTGKGNGAELEPCKHQHSKLTCNMALFCIA